MLIQALTISELEDHPSSFEGQNECASKMFTCVKYEFRWSQLTVSPSHEKATEEFRLTQCVFLLAAWTCCSSSLECAGD